MAIIDFGGVKEDVVMRKEFSMAKARKILKNETIAVIGYGVQGPAQALNMKDNGFNVIIGQSKKFKKDWKRQACQRPNPIQETKRPGKHYAKIQISILFTLPHLGPGTLQWPFMPWKMGNMHALKCLLPKPLTNAGNWLKRRKKRRNIV